MTCTIEYIREPYSVHYFNQMFKHYYGVFFTGLILYDVTFCLSGTEKRNGLECFYITIRDKVLG